MSILTVGSTIEATRIGQRFPNQTVWNFESDSNYIDENIIHNQRQWGYEIPLRLIQSCERFETSYLDFRNKHPESISTLLEVVLKLAKNHYVTLPEPGKTSLSKPELLFERFEATIVSAGSSVWHLQMPDHTLHRNKCLSYIGGSAPRHEVSYSGGWLLNQKPMSFNGTNLANVALLGMPLRPVQMLIMRAAKQYHRLLAQHNYMITDIHPRNILLVAKQGSLEPQVIDFTEGIDNEDGIYGVSWEEYREWGRAQTVVDLAERLDSLIYENVFENSFANLHQLKDN